MIPIHTIYVLTLISQTTTAAALALLAWNEHRLSGLRALAIACGLHAGAILMMPLWRNANLLVPEVVSAAFLPTIFLLIHEGLESLLLKRERPSHLWRAIVAFSVVVVVALAPLNQLWSMQVARLAGVVVIGRTVWMLWRTRADTTRIPARVTAVLLASALLTFAARVPIEPRVPASGRLLISLREMNMVEISLLAFSFLALYQAESKRLLYEETRRDVLTGLLNRRAIEEMAVEETRNSERTGTALALLMLDIDLFKALNDQWGHPFGDHALRSVAETLRREVQSPRISVGRMSGEEFVVLLPDYSASAAQLFAESIRAAVAGLVLVQDGRRAQVTVSIGVAIRCPGEINWVRMLHRADKALYQAKRSGRNCVALCDEAMEIRSGARGQIVARSLRIDSDKSAYRK